MLPGAACRGAIAGHHGRACRRPRRSRRRSPRPCRRRGCAEDRAADRGAADLLGAARAAGDSPLRKIGSVCSATSLPSARTSVWKRMPMCAAFLHLAALVDLDHDADHARAGGNRDAARRHDVARDARVDAILDARALGRQRRFELQADHRRRPAGSLPRTAARAAARAAARRASPVPARAAAAADGPARRRRGRTRRCGRGRAVRGQPGRGGAADSVRVFAAWRRAGAAGFWAARRAAASPGLARGSASAVRPRRARARHCSRVTGLRRGHRGLGFGDRLRRGAGCGRRRRRRGPPAAALRRPATAVRSRCDGWPRRRRPRRPSRTREPAEETPAVWKTLKLTPCAPGLSKGRTLRIAVILWVSRDLRHSPGDSRCPRDRTVRSRLGRFDQCTADPTGWRFRCTIEAVRHRRFTCCAAPLSRLLAVLALAAGRAEAVTIRDVIELSKAGLSDQVLLALIEVDRSVFAIDTATLKQLKDAGVSDAVIVAHDPQRPHAAPPEPAPAPVPTPIRSRPPRPRAAGHRHRSSRRAGAGRRCRIRSRVPGLP